MMWAFPSWPAVRHTSPLRVLQTTCTADLDRGPLTPWSCAATEVPFSTSHTRTRPWVSPTTTRPAPAKAMQLAKPPTLSSSGKRTFGAPSPLLSESTSRTTSVPSPEMATKRSPAGSAATAATRSIAPVFLRAARQSGWRRTSLSFLRPRTTTTSDSATLHRNRSPPGTTHSPFTRRGRPWRARLSAPRTQWSLCLTASPRPKGFSRSSSMMRSCIRKPLVLPRERRELLVPRPGGAVSVEAWKLPELVLLTVLTRRWKRSRRCRTTSSGSMTRSPMLNVRLMLPASSALLADATGSPGDPNDALGLDDRKEPMPTDGRGELGTSDVGAAFGMGSCK
mmetsp:Transcript_10457/g.32436  ORF Transcript_10457/g.32436 Transcript_10457/m.32436 type:complete len:337 (-) Transcript_10457:235-1245(-)